MLLVKSFVVLKLKDLEKYFWLLQTMEIQKVSFILLEIKKKPRKKWLCPDYRQQQLLSIEVSFEKTLNELDSPRPIIIE